MSEDSHDGPSDDLVEQIEVEEEGFDVIRDLGRASDSERPTRSFEPWHRPRKHYVRRNQWSKSVGQLIGDEEISDEIAYLGLPGEELLDVRYLADGPIADAGLSLRFLGFRQDSSAEAGVGDLPLLEEVRNHPRISPSSRIQPDDIRRLSNELSPAYRASLKAAPFDVVNFDLTQSLFATPVAEIGSYPEALRQVLGVQVAARRDWLMWITMRVDRQSVDRDVAASLWAHLRQRFDECEEALGEWLPEQFDAENPDDVNLEDCSASDFAGVLFLGFCVWLSDLVRGPREHRMKVVSCMGYRVANSMEGPCDMLSVVIRFSPQPAVPPDRSGVTAGAQSTRIGAGPCARLVTFIRRHRKIVDVDACVLADDDLKADLVDETASLLEQIGFDRQQYELWVAGFPT